MDWCAVLLRNKTESDHNNGIPVNKTENSSTSNDTVSSAAQNAKTSIMTDDVIEWSPHLICMWIIVPGLCIIGLLGNTLTLVVLSSRLKDGIETLEKGSLAGMIALATSDFFFCVITVSEVSLQDDSLIHRSWSISLYVTMYFKYFQNLFIKVSTHIILVMAVYRYFALVHPIQACKYMNHIVLYKLIGVMAGVVFWVLFLLPLIWMWDTREIICGKGNIFILLRHGIFPENKLLYKVFNYSWNVTGFLLPLCILLYCNAGIIRAIYRSRRKSRSQSQSNQRQNTQRRTSITLVSIVVCFCLLVSPTESLELYFVIVGENHTPEWNLIAIIANVLLTLNMSINFALYCVVNSQFRKTIPVLYIVVNNRIRKLTRRICNRCCDPPQEKGMYRLHSIVSEAAVTEAQC